ncbi:MAG: T9SS type A sorting domain-containing protein [Saprospiraceae bacterium]|nr:T9SS type A sorting domain-containing protein [Saprospiraceae bacterium]
MITNLAPGTYTVIVTDANGCIREFTVVLEEAVGTISLDILTSINVYPNPNTGSFWVEASFSKNTSIDLSVMDLLGRRVFNQQFEGQELKTSIDLKEFNSGTFFVVISSNNGQHVEKISIVK